MITFELEGVEELAKRLGVDLRPALRAATFAVGEQLRGKIARYPGPSSLPVKWSSVKQQRFYHAMRREAGLPLKYTRQSDPGSQRLGPSWTTEHSGDTDAVVGTRVTYAKWVQSSEMQWQQHAASGWVTDKQAIEQVKESGVVDKILRDAVEHALNTAGV